VGDPKAPAILLIMGSATQMIAWWALSINPGIDVMGQLQLPCLGLLSFLKPGCTISSISHKEFAWAHFG